MGGQNNHQKEYITLGSYTEKEANILKTELAKNDIPVQVFNPASNILEHAGREEWLACLLMIPKSKVLEALAICEKLNLLADIKKPVPTSDRVFNWIILLLIAAGIFIAVYYFWGK